MPTKFQLITELYDHTLKSVTASYQSWTGFLRAACYNYKCPFDEQILIYAQRPDATAVLEMNRWNRQFGRWVNRGAKSIAVFGDDGKNVLKLYFDVSDTHESRFSRPLPIWRMDAAFEPAVIETLENTFGDLAEKRTLADAVRSASHNAVADNFPDYLQDLQNCREDSLLEELDDLNLEVFYRDALEVSVAYMLLTRLGLRADDHFDPDEFAHVYDFNTPPTINALGIATSDIAEMGLREISRTVMQAQKEQFFAKDGQNRYDANTERQIDTERSEIHGSHIPDAGRLSFAEPADAAGAVSPSGQIRGAAAAVPDEAPARTLHQPENELPPDGASGGDRADGAEDGGTDRGTDGQSRGRNGGTEGDRPAALDGPNEQLQALSGGNGAERSDLRLTTEEPTEAGSDENALPAFLDTHLIEAILLDDGGRKHKRQDIFNYFQTHQNLAERTEFLKNSYNDIWVEVLAGTDKVRVGYHAEPDGLLMWEGSYLSRTSESVFSWPVITEMTEGLIERGEYKIKLGLQNVPVMAEQLALFDMGGDAPVYEAPEGNLSSPLFPAKEVPQAVIDQALYTAGNSYNSAYRVAVFYMRERPEADCIAFLRREFGKENGRGIEYEGRKYAAWFMEDGIHLAQGDSIRTGYSPTVVTWERASARILELLEAGTYLSAAELEQAPDKVLSEMADALLMTARELTKEGRAKGLFPQTLAIHDQHKGYPELDADVVAFAKRDGGLSALAEEYHAFLNAYAQDDSITRFRLSPYNTHRIGVVLDGLSYPERSFTAQPDFLRQCKMFITQDEIDRFFLSGSVEERLSVYSHFCYPHTPDESQKFIKSQFGEYSGGGYDGYDYTKTHKGLTYQRDYARKRYAEVKLTIPNVIKTYERLIAQKRFPGEDAIAQIPQYELHRLARTVYNGFYNAPEDVPRPYPKGADFYAAVPAIEAQLPDQVKASEMLESLTARLDGMTEGERYFNSIRDAKNQLSAYVDGTFSLFNHKHDAPQQDTALKQEEVTEVRSDETTASEPKETAQYTSETVEYYPAEETKLPFDVEVQVLRTKEPEPPLDRGSALTPPRKKTHTALAHPLDASGSNYRITDDHIGEGAPLERFQRNLNAIRLLKTVEAEDRAATAEEQAVLAQYVGWGGLADFFDEKNARYGELKELLTDAEYAAARESTLTAFYTPPVVIRSIYAALEQMGFQQGNILEPSCGVGNFLGMLPESMADSKLYGVELDDLSGRMARQLYQRSGIAVQGYEKIAFPDNFFDVAVGNVPFGQFKVADKRYDRLNLSIHEYFIAKTLDKVRPGGVIAFVTSSFTMDKRTANVRKYIAQRAELLGAIRLPNNAFKAAAGTEVVSDILFLQKRDRMVDIEPEWVHLATNDDGIQMNSYFVDSPDMVLGEMKMVSGPYGPEPTCAPFPDQPLDSLLASAIQNIHGEITAYDREEELEGEDRSIEADPTVRNFSYTLVDGKIYYRENSRMNPIEVSVTAANRIKGLIGIRDCVRTLIEYQTEDWPDQDIQAQQRELNALYDAFVDKYGRINSRANSSVFSMDSAYFLLTSLEVLDDERNFVRKADMFIKRTIKQRITITHVDTASEALAVSLAEKAKVDMDYMAELTGKTEQEVYADLTGVIFLNPMHGYGGGSEEKYLTADEYLSGNVREKLAQAKAMAEQDSAFSTHVQALERVQPVDLTASEIAVRLGATWIPTTVVEQFMYELFNTPPYCRRNIRVHYFQATGEWSIEGKFYDKSNIKAYNTYGTERINGYKIIEETLNLRDVRIFDYVEDAAGKRTPVLNKKETAIAQGKQELIKQAFQDWIWKDPQRRERLIRLYNDKFNMGIFAWNKSGLNLRVISGIILPY